MGFFGSGANFEPNHDIPDLSGKVILVTGGTDGLGKASCLEISKHNPAHLYIAGRREEAAAEVTAQIKTASPTVSVSFLKLDLASFESIHAAAKTFLQQSQRLDILMNNAGVMALEPGLSKEGYEIQFGINHVGHALLTKLLMPTLLKSAEGPNSDVRVIFLTSSGHNLAPSAGIIFKDLKTTQTTITREPSWGRYGQSKLANILYVAELAKHHPQITFLSIHPGVVNTTGLLPKAKYNSWLFKVVTDSIMWFMDVPVSQGIKNQLWGAFASNGTITNGAYYEPIGISGKGSAYAKNKDLAKHLWDWTEKELEDQTL